MLRLPQIISILTPLKSFRHPQGPPTPKWSESLFSVSMVSEDISVSVMIASHCKYCLHLLPHHQSVFSWKAGPSLVLHVQDLTYSKVCLACEMANWMYEFIISICSELCLTNQRFDNYAFQVEMD